MQFPIPKSKEASSDRAFGSFGCGVCGGGDLFAGPLRGRARRRGDYEHDFPKAIVIDSSLRSVSDGDPKLEFHDCFEDGWGCGLG